MPPVGCATSVANRSPAPTSTPTTTGSSATWACGSGPTGISSAASRPPSAASRRSAHSSSRCGCTPTRTAPSAARACRAVPTNSGKSTLNTYIHHNLAGGALTLRADSTVQRIVIEDRATGPRRPGSSTPTRTAPGTGRRRCGRGGVRVAVDAVAAAALGGAQPDDRPNAGAAPGAVRVRAVRRAPGLPHGRADHQPLQPVRGRRRRRVRGRGGDRPGPDRVRGEPVRRGRSDVGPAAGRRDLRTTGAGSGC